MKVRVYKTITDKQPFYDWLNRLKDRSIRARVRRRIDRLSLGNEGDYKAVGQGVFELRLAFGSGYRIYYGKIHDRVIILLCAGDKATQEKDIKMAQEYWIDCKERFNEK